ncbi:MAG: type IV pilin protein [Gammaproteobacteria bacterium]|nr:type IV pilin protein [Gammaproteobacteria bacterium]
MKRKESGFTLVELMIVVAIIGILAAIAYPSYQDSVRKSRRAQAITDMYSIQLAQEKWRANNSTYGTLANVWGTVTTSPATGTAYYNLAISGNTATAYTLTATATTAGGQNNDKAGGISCTPLTLNHNGPVGQPACWAKN